MGEGVGGAPGAVGPASIEVSQQGIRVFFPVPSLPAALAQAAEAGSAAAAAAVAAGGDGGMGGQTTTTTSAVVVPSDVHPGTPGARGLPHSDSMTWQPMQAGPSAVTGPPSAASAGYNSGAAPVDPFAEPTGAPDTSPINTPSASGMGAGPGHFSTRFGSAATGASVFPDATGVDTGRAGSGMSATGFDSQAFGAPQE